MKVYLFVDMKSVVIYGIIEKNNSILLEKFENDVCLNLIYVKQSIRHFF